MPHLSTRTVSKLVFASMLCLSSAATAQSTASEPYLGIGVGDLDYKLRSDGTTFFNASATTITVYGGFWISPQWAFEGSWQLTETSEQFGPVGDFPELAALQLPATATMLTASQLEIFTLRALRFERFAWGAVFAGFGISGAHSDNHIDVTDTSNGNTIRANPRPSKNGFTLAFGTQWDFRRFSLRLGYEWWDDDISTIELGVHRRL